MKRNEKWKIPHTVLERQILCFSSYRIHKLKVKLWWVGAGKRKKRAFYVPFIFREEIFLIFVLSQCIAYCIHFQKIHTFTYQKSIISYAFFLFLKIIKSFQCILMEIMSIAQFDNTKILIGSDDKLPELFLEDALYVK